MVSTNVGGAKMPLATAQLRHTQCASGVPLGKPLVWGKPPALHNVWHAAVATLSMNTAGYKAMTLEVDASDVY